MRPYVISLAVGVLVGVIYALLKVRSPAPPTIALIGLLGMLIGEQVVPLVKSYFVSRQEARVIRTSCTDHMLGRLPSNTETTETSV